jgi:hypothetical protein
VKHWLKRTIALIEADRAKNSGGAGTTKVVEASAPQSVPK